MDPCTSPPDDAPPTAVSTAEEAPPAAHGADECPGEPEDAPSTHPAPSPSGPSPSGPSPSGPSPGFLRRLVRCCREELGRRPCALALSALALAVAVAAASFEHGQIVESQREFAAAGPSLVVSYDLLLDSSAPTFLSEDTMIVHIRDEPWTVGPVLIKQHPSVSMRIKLENRGRSPMSIDAIGFSSGSDPDRYFYRYDVLGWEPYCGTSETRLGACADTVPLTLDPGRSAYVFVDIGSRIRVVSSSPGVRDGIPFWLETSGLPQDRTAYVAPIRIRL